MLELDRTRIAIRERNFAELMDLALLVLRNHAGAWLMALAAGATPLALLNYWLLAGTLDEFYLNGDPPVAYLFWMTLLVTWEAPLATCWITLYLGQVLFVSRPSLGRMLRDGLLALPQMLVFQGLLRGALILPVVTWPLLYFVWPYLSEIILLERNPWVKRNAAGVSTLSRTSLMHRGMAGELFARWVMSLALAGALLGAVFGSIWYLAHWMNLGQDDSTAVLTVYFPLALWIVVGYFAVVRFLSYLDLRIRTEGWEIELAMRAEGARWASKLA